MIKVLDHGYVKLIENWGSDERIIEAARMSTNKGFQGWPGDEKLLRYLWEHQHHTPFEMAGMTIEVQAPLFVFREWHRHRTQSYNELSARYVPMPDMNYMPTAERIIEGAKGTGNKQATGIKTLIVEELGSWLEKVDETYRAAESVYLQGLALGIPKEVARIVIPVGRYSRMRASANLRNWLHFLKLRMDNTAQWEIRQYANVVGTLVEHSFPRTWRLFKEGI